MKKRLYHFLRFALFVLLLVGCEPKTSLVLTFSERENTGYMERELRSIAEVLRLNGSYKYLDQNKLVFRFNNKLKEEEKSYFVGILDRAVKIKGDNNPRYLTIEIIDSPQVGKILEFQGNKKRFALNVLKGKHHIKTRVLHSNAVVYEYCTYDVPTEPTIPDLLYWQKFGPQPDDPDGQQRLQSYKDRLAITGPLLVNHRFEFGDPKLNKAAKRIELQTQNTVSFILHSGWAERKHETFPNTKTVRELRECHQRIVNYRDDAFFGLILFPGLSTSLESYTFIQ